MLFLLSLLPFALAITNGVELSLGGLQGPFVPFDSLASVYNNDYADGNFFQGAGVFIGPNHLLTTALTCGTITANHLEVALGSYTRPADGSTGEAFVPVSKVTPHPLFNITNFDYDFCLIEIQGRAPVIPAVLPAAAVAQNQIGTLVGWGATFPEGPKVVTARDAPVTVHRSCVDAWKGIREITPRMNCNEALPDLSASACTDEFGSPVYDSTGEIVLGLSSFGTWSGGRFRKGGIADCTSRPRPNVNADVFSVKDWIEKTSGIVV